MKLVKLLIVLFLVFFTGCSTVVSLKIDRISEIKLPNIEKVAIDNFKASGNFTEAKKRNNSIARAVVDVAQAINEPKLIKQRNKEYVNYNRIGLQSTLANNGFYTVVVSGRGQDVKLNGNISYVGNDEIKVVTEKITTKKSSNKKASVPKTSTSKYVSKHILKRTVTVTTMFNVIDKDGVNLGSSSAISTVSSSYSSKHKNISIDKVEEWDVLVKRGIANNWNIIAKKIAPYYDVVRRTLAKGNSSKIKEGNEFVEYGDWESASDAWWEARNGSDKDKSAYYYNESLYFLSKGDLIGSLDLLRKAYEIRKNKKWFREIQFLEGIINEQAEYEYLQNQAISEAEAEAEAETSTIDGSTFLPKKKSRSSEKLKSLEAMQK